MKLCLFVYICITLAYGRTIPDYIPQCKRSDPNIEKCIIDGVEAMKPRLKEGIPELNLPSLEPFRMKLLNVDTSVTGSTLKATFTNIVAYGGSNFEINKLKVDLDNKYEGVVKLVFPRMQLSADYNSRRSRVLFYTINGGGKFEGTFNDVTVEAKCVASAIVKNGVEYLQLDSITTKVTIGNGDLNVRPTEDSISGRAATWFINSTPSMVLNYLSPVLDETAALIVQQYLNNILSAVPLHDVLIDS